MPNARFAALIVCGLVPYPSSSQRIQKSESSRAIDRAADNVSSDKPSNASQTLTPDDGLAVIAAALDSRIHLRAKRDCSHLVHAIYDRAGFPYRYASYDISLWGETRALRSPHSPLGAGGMGEVYRARDTRLDRIVEGETLASRLAKGPLPTDQVLKYGIQICDGLENGQRWPVKPTIRRGAV